MRNPIIAELEAESGISFPGATGFLPRRNEMGMDGKAIPGRYAGFDNAKLQAALDGMGFDALPYQQQPLVTSPSGAIPAMLTTMIDPKMIQVLLTPLKSEEIYGVTKKGDWTTDTWIFSLIEMTGFVSAYGDFNESGRSGANVNFPQRQNALWQTITEWGDREADRMALARVTWAAELNISSANTLNRFGNLVNFYGWGQGLLNYGGLNDPSLSASLTPATKAAGGTGWKNALPTEILADVQAMFAQLQVQSPGNTNRETPMTLAIHPTSDIYIANTNQFGLTAAEMIKKAFPNITIKTAVQYLNGTTYTAQLIVDQWPDGQATAECAFSVKMQAHRIVNGLSSQKQKKSAGGWGTIIYRPIGFAAMAGI